MFFANILSSEIKVYLVKLIYTYEILYMVIEHTNCDKKIVNFIFIYCMLEYIARFLYMQYYYSVVYYFTIIASTEFFIHFQESVSQIGFPYSCSPPPPKTTTNKKPAADPLDFAMPGFWRKSLSPQGKVLVSFMSSFLSAESRELNNKIIEVKVRICG